MDMFHRMLEYPRIVTTLSLTTVWTVVLFKVSSPSLKLLLPTHLRVNANMGLFKKEYPKLDCDWISTKKDKGFIAALEANERATGDQFYRFPTHVDQLMKCALVACWRGYKIGRGEQTDLAGYSL